MDLEKLQQQIQELQDRTSSLETENESLKKSRAGHLTDLARYKGVNRILNAAGIDPKDEAAEDHLTDLLVNLRAPEQEKRPPVAEATPPKPANTDAATGAAPADAISATMQASIASMQKELAGLRGKLEESESKVAEERRKRREDRADRIVLSVMEDVGVKDRQRTHLLKLLKLDKAFHIAVDEDASDDADPIVLFGTEDSPKTLKDGLGELSLSDQWSDFYVSNTPSGSGLPTSRSTSANSFVNASGNPFMSPGNSTEAARIYQQDPKGAQRLYNQAKSAGKLDPHCAKIITP